MTVADLALSEAAVEIVTLEAEHVNALQEASAYRGLLLVALDAWHADKARLRKAEQRILSLTGMDAVDPDDPAS